jgi:hypothetical protein
MYIDNVGAIHESPLRVFTKAQLLCARAFAEPHGSRPKETFTGRILPRHGGDIGPNTRLHMAGYI